MTRPEDLTVQIGDALRLARRRRRLSQRQLADVLQVSKSTVAALESGRGVTGFDLVLAILDGAGLTVELVDRELGSFDTDQAPEEIRDAAGRRFPAHCSARPITFPHHWWFVRHPPLPRRYWPTWTWRHDPLSAWSAKPTTNRWLPADGDGQDGNSRDGDPS